MLQLFQYLDLPADGKEEGREREERERGGGKRERKKDRGEREREGERVLQSTPLDHITRFSVTCGRACRLHVAYHMCTDSGHYIQTSATDYTIANC